MLTIAEAFSKFRGRLQLSPQEKADASRRQTRIREQVRAELAVQSDFLTGSYIRDTKTKPLKDVDIFVVLADSESDYLDQLPDGVLDRLHSILSPHYPGRVRKANRSIKVDFDVPNPKDEEVVSFDVVPAFSEGDHFKIPDRRQAGWITTNPTIHKQKATDANAAFDKQWKPLVKMIKKWNAYQKKPVKPSFLLEVMALDLLDPPWGGSYPRELRQFFASAAESLDQDWPEPACLGPPVTARMTENQSEREEAKRALRAAEAACTEAFRLEQQGRTGAALDAWQQLFGPRFAKS
jgi:predicted nucleotidyltransferase